MPQKAIHSPHLRVVFLGTRARFSVAALSALLEAGINVAAVVVPAAEPRAAGSSSIVHRPAPSTHSLLPILNPFLNQDVTTVAWQQGIPVFEVHQLGAPNTLATIAALQADLGCVACFPRRLPPSLLELMPCGWVNVHPSLLPAYRGPAPLFWIMRQNAEGAGVTLHMMDEGLDTGDIVAQERIAWPDGSDGAAIDQWIGRRGGMLLVDVLTAIANDTLIRHPQPAVGTSAPWPNPADFTIDPTWSARRAYNFIRATAEWQQPYPLTINSVQLLLVDAIDYTVDQQPSEPFTISGNIVQIQFGTDVLTAVLV